jgi:hypothetical protein
MGSARVQDSADTVRRYMKTQERRSQSSNVYAKTWISELASLPIHHSFPEALTVLLTLVSERRLCQHLEHFDCINLFVMWPDTHAGIKMKIGRSWYMYQKVTVIADYESSTSSPCDVRSALKRSSLKHWTQTNAEPLLFVGALLGGWLDELLEVNEHQTLGMHKKRRVSWSDIVR